MKALTLVLLCWIWQVSGICTYTALDGTVFDLSPMRNDQTDYTFPTELYTYTINVCRNTVIECAEPSPACQRQLGSSLSVGLGTLASQNISEINLDRGFGGLAIDYSGGDDQGCGFPRQARYEILCNYSATTPRLLNVAEDILCSYTFTFESRSACPQSCSVGFRGSNCNLCQQGFYGPNCTPCNCRFGTCNDTITGDGSCDCEFGWSGPQCDQCSPERCTFNTPDMRYMYNLTQIVLEDFDYSFFTRDPQNIQFAYYVNFLADLNEPCGGIENPAACQKVGDSQGNLSIENSLGDSSTQVFSPMSAITQGLRISYVNGSLCGSSPRTLDINLNCDRNSETRILGVSEPALCTYLMNVESKYACPECLQPNTWGAECQPCVCSEFGTCDSGFLGTGVCTCQTGYTGQQCSDCATGYYKSGSQCILCTCQNGGTCNQTTGECSCIPGFAPPDCAACLPNHYGPNCTPCPCDQMGTLSCNETISGNGACLCKSYFSGTQCATCAANAFGEECLPCQCNLEVSVCDSGKLGSGRCLCIDGRVGTNCGKARSDLENLGPGIGIGVGIGVVVLLFVLCLLYGAFVLWIKPRMGYKQIDDTL